MDLTPYVARLHQDLAAVAETAGEDSRRVAERLMGALESSVRLTLLEALSAAADEITSRLAPGSVDVRLRGGAPEFVVTGVAADTPAPAAQAAPAAPEPDPGDGNTARVSLRLPEHLKASIEQAAARSRQSVNTWLVDAAQAALTEGSTPRAETTGGGFGQSFTGWVR